MRRVILFLIVLAAATPARAAGPETSIRAARDDARKLPAKVAYRTRYQTLFAIPAAERPAWKRKLLKAWANCLSREPEFGELREVGDDVVAMLLDDFQWSPEVWEKQANVEPFLHFQKWYARNYYVGKTSGKGAWYDAGYYPEPLPGPTEAAHRELMGLTGSYVPIVLADWWLFYSSRQIDLNNKEQGFGYLDWLGVQKQKDFEDLRFVDRKKAIKLGDELRAALEEKRSRVAQKDRQIEWYSTYGDGDFWLTNDTDDTSHGNTAPGNLAEKEFKAIAREGYITLPNELWGFWAGNQKGEKQTTVPPQIASDESPFHQGNDRRIHYFSCLHCHTNGGLQDIDDWARRTLRAPQQLESDRLDDFLRLKKQYFRSLDDRIQRGRKRYTAALDRCVPGLTPGAFARLHATAYYGYLRSRTSAEAALLLGVSDDCLLAALRCFFDKANVEEAEDKKRLAILENWTAKQPDVVPIAHVEQFFYDLQKIVSKHGVRP